MVDLHRLEQGAAAVTGAAHMEIALPAIVAGARESMSPDSTPLPPASTAALRVMGKRCLELGGLFWEAAGRDDAKRAGLRIEADPADLDGRRTNWSSYGLAYYLKQGLWVPTEE